MSQLRRFRERYLPAIMRLPSSGGSVMLALVADQACARFFAPDFIQAMPIQVGQRVTVGLGMPL